MFRIQALVFFYMGVIFLSWSSSSYAQGILMMELETSRAECRRICYESALGYLDDSCGMAYYFVGGNNRGTCRITQDQEPNLQMKGSYRIYSPYFDRWLNNDLIAYKWPHVSGPIGTQAGTGALKSTQVNWDDRKSYENRQGHCYQAYKKFLAPDKTHGNAGAGKAVMYYAITPNNKIVCSVGNDFSNYDALEVKVKSNCDEYLKKYRIGKCEKSIWWRQ